MPEDVCRRTEIVDGGYRRDMGWPRTKELRPLLTVRWIDDPYSGSVAWHADYQRILDAAGMRIGYRVPKQPTVFVFDGDEAVGVAQGHVVRDGFNERFGPFESLPVPQSMLDKVAVLPAAQGRGLGRLLVREFATGMSSKWGATHVALLVDQSTEWENRVKFFESCGFSSLIEGSDDDLLGAEISTLLRVTAP
jgi:GNAT superfamily N-acetyltransferase